MYFRIPLCSGRRGSHAIVPRGIVLVAQQTVGWNCQCPKESILMNFVGNESHTAHKEVQGEVKSAILEKEKIRIQRNNYQGQNTDTAHVF